METHIFLNDDQRYHHRIKCWCNPVIIGSAIVHDVTKMTIRGREFISGIVWLEWSNDDIMKLGKQIKDKRWLNKILQP